MMHGKINGGAVQFEVPKVDEIASRILRPNSFWLLVRLLDVKQETTTESGLKLIVPDSDKEQLENEMTIGYVQKLGALAYTNERFLGNKFCQEGDYILFGRFSGFDIEFNGVRYKYLQDDRPFSTFKEEELIEVGLLSKKE
jgi:co-chaperonin GroES (HSP10)